MRQTIFTFFFIAISINCSAQLPDFFREYITVELSNEYVEINGVYDLRNNSGNPQNINLFYPFPIDSMYNEVSNVYAFETTKDSTLNRLMKINKKGAMVKLEIDARSVKTLYIGYQQKLNGHKAEYILTTTKNWGKPLESSQIELIVPNNIKVESISYQAKDTLVSDDKTHYFIHELNFMPVKNFIVNFSDR